MVKILTSTACRNGNNLFSSKTVFVVRSYAVLIYVLFRICGINDCSFTVSSCSPGWTCGPYAKSHNSAERHCCGFTDVTASDLHRDAAFVPPELAAETLMEVLLTVLRRCDGGGSSDELATSCLS